MTEIMCDRCGRDWDARDFYDNGGNDGICPKCQWSVHECGNCGERIVEQVNDNYVEYKEDFYCGEECLEEKKKEEESMSTCEKCFAVPPENWEKKGWEFCNHDGWYCPCHSPTMACSNWGVCSCSCSNCNENV